MISENAINNNSLVCKLVYKNFSILFTGDIEKIAENEILDMYSNRLYLLKSNILKVAHHGSKTSSIKEFVESVSPHNNKKYGGNKMKKTYILIILFAVIILGITAGIYILYQMKNKKIRK